MYLGRDRNIWIGFYYYLEIFVNVWDIVMYIGNEWGIWSKMMLVSVNFYKIKISFFFWKFVGFIFLDLFGNVLKYIIGMGLYNIIWLFYCIGYFI